MSTQSGNLKKKGAPKHANRTAFKNNLHDTSKLTKALNTMTIGGVCHKCKETIQWKIKYKKYKPLTQPKKCTKCSQKTVKYAYHVICTSCAQDGGICAKCGSNEKSVNPFALSPSEQAAEDSKLEAELKNLSERKRRAFFRYQDKGFPEDDPKAGSAKEADNFEDKEEEDVSNEEDGGEKMEEELGDDREEAGDQVDIKDDLVNNVDDVNTSEHEKQQNATGISCVKDSVKDEQGNFDLASTASSGSARESPDIESCLNAQKSDSVDDQDHADIS